MTRVSLSFHFGVFWLNDAKQIRRCITKEDVWGVKCMTRNQSTRQTHGQACEDKKLFLGTFRNLFKKKPLPSSAFLDPASSHFPEHKYTGFYWTELQKSKPIPTWLSDMNQSAETATLITLMEMMDENWDPSPICRTHYSVLQIQL